MGSCYSHLSAAEREEISRGLALGWSYRAIAQGLQRNVSSICREVKRHAPVPHWYRAAPAHRRAQRRARCPRRVRKLCQPWLARHVQTALMAGWSPE